MASFDLQWRKSTSKDLRRIPREAVPRIVAAVAKLAEEPLPHGSEKLTGSEHTYPDSCRRLSRRVRASPQRENCGNSTRAASERRLQVAQIANSQRSTR